jgi:hypothetical protein
MLILTDSEILTDIEDFKKRIQAAEAKLDMLPDGYLPYQEHKKRAQQQRVLEDEIAHVKRLIGIAAGAL